jgi:hypothetical protein
MTNWSQSDNWHSENHDHRLEVADVFRASGEESLSRRVTWISARNADVAPSRITPAEIAADQIVFGFDPVPAPHRRLSQPRSTGFGDRLSGCSRGAVHGQSDDLRRYFVTPYGWKVARLFSRLEARVFRPAVDMFSGDDAVLPFPLRASLHRVDAQLDELIGGVARFVAFANLVTSVKI